MHFPATRQTGSFIVTKACRYHDHMNPPVPHPHGGAPWNLPVFRRSPAVLIRAGLWLVALVLAAAGAFSAGACGSGSPPSTPSTPAPTATPPPGGAVTVTIVGGVVSPKQGEINVGQPVAFVNN